LEREGGNVGNTTRLVPRFFSGAGQKKEGKGHSTRRSYASEIRPEKKRGLLRFSIFALGEREKGKDAGGGCWWHLAAGRVGEKEWEKTGIGFRASRWGEKGKAKSRLKMC